MTNLKPGQKNSAAWKIASRYSGVLASETRDLAFLIDEAIRKEKIRTMKKASKIIKDNTKNGSLEVIGDSLAGLVECGIMKETEQGEDK